MIGATRSADGDRLPSPGDERGPTDELLRWRGEFPIVEKSLYLISHSLGAMPVGALRGLRKFAEAWRSRGPRAWEEEGWESARIAGDRIARILGAAPSSVAIQPGVSAARAAVVSDFDPTGPRRKFVLFAEDAPSLLQGWERQRRLGAEVVLVPSRDGLSVPLDGILAAIDESTALVCVSQVFHKTGELLDLPAIVEKAHALGAAVLVDADHGLGTVPLDVGILPVDFVLGSSAKWLCGGPGTAYLYVRPHPLARREPRATGQSANAPPSSPRDLSLEVAADARQMLAGTPPVAAAYAARAGLDLVASIGVGKIRAKSVRQTSRLVGLAGELGLRVASPRDAARRGGTVTIDVPNGAAVTAAIATRHVLVDYWPGAGLRVSPHFYTRDEEIDAFVRELLDVLQRKAWVPFVGRGAPSGPDSPGWRDLPDLPLAFGAPSARRPRAS